MTYGCWNIRCNRQKILSFWTIFCPFRPLKTWKIKILKLKKTLGDIIIWRICTINDNHIMYGSWDKNFCHSWLSFALLPPYGPTKSKFFKNEKTSEDIIILQMLSINDSHMMYGSWDIECNRQNVLSFLTVFCTFTKKQSKKSKCRKNEKNTWRYHFTQVHHKWKSYDVWFLRYRAIQMLFFVILDHFCPFISLTT